MSYYSEYMKAKRKYKKQNGHAQKGKKIRETRELRSKLLKKFPLGEFVSIKYNTKSIGIISGPPEIKRHKYFDYEKKCFLDMLHPRIPVLWMSGVSFAGEVHSFPPEVLKKPNMKKVLESDKKV